MTLKLFMCVTLLISTPTACTHILIYALLKQAFYQNILDSVIVHHKHSCPNVPLSHRPYVARRLPLAFSRSLLCWRRCAVPLALIPSRLWQCPGYHGCLSLAHSYTRPRCSTQATVGRISLSLSHTMREKKVGSNEESGTGNRITSVWHVW